MIFIFDIITILYDILSFLSFYHDYYRIFFCFSSSFRLFSLAQPSKTLPRRYFHIDFHYCLRQASLLILFFASFFFADDTPFSFTSFDFLLSSDYAIFRRSFFISMIRHFSLIRWCHYFRFFRYNTLLCAIRISLLLLLLYIRYFLSLFSMIFIDDPIYFYCFRWWLLFIIRHHCLAFLHARHTCRKDSSLTKHFITAFIAIR